MVEFICTPYGKQSRDAIFRKARVCLENGKRGYLLVPEQQVLAYEDEAGKHLPPSAPLSFTVTSFSLLADIAKRRFGARSGKTLSKPQKVLFMWKAIKETAPFLSLYGRTSPESLCTRMLECTDELKAAGIDADALEDACAYLADSPMFAKKLSDIASVYAAYTALTENRYSDINDELKKLLSLLDGNDMFSGHDIFIESFTDFTPLQLGVLSHMIRKADNVYISIPSDPINDTGIQFECIRKTYSDIKEICDRFKKEHKVSVLPRLEEECALSYFSENLFSAAPKKYTGKHEKNEKAEAFECLDVQEEICACVNLIKRALYNGYALSDIAVIARDTSAYERLLALSAADAGITMFTADKKRVLDSCFAVYVISLLRIMAGGWKRSDILAHLKCGISGFSPEDINRFDLYTSRWDIDGRARFCGADFSAPYARFTRAGREDDEFLISANKIKKELFSRILLLEEKLTGAKTLKEMLILLFRYIESANAAGELRKLSGKMADNGDVRTAEQNARAYNSAIKLFDEIAYALDNEPAMSVKDLCSVTELVFSNTEISSIPARKDEVILADASLYRSFGHKVVILLGMNEGSFPKSVHFSGLITDAEKRILRNEGLRLEPSAVTSASKEYYHLWKAVSMAKEQLYMTYARRLTGEGEKGPSVAVRNLSDLLGKGNVKVFTECMAELLYDPYSTFGGLSSLDNSDIFKFLANRYCKETLPMGIRLGGRNVFISQSQHLSRELAQEIMPLQFTVSPTALEAFNKCPFSYFCSRILKLDDGKKNEFSALITGTLVHSILEKYLADGKSYTAEETEQICRRIADEYYEKNCPEHLVEDERLKLNFIRAAINASLLARFVTKDLSSSRFTPSDFEKTVSVPLTDDKSLWLEGRIDRVDSLNAGPSEFVRVVDYKSGSKHFTFEDLRDGIELQLPLYLYALLKEDTKNAPGGFMYLSSAVSRYDVSSAKELEACDETDVTLATRIEASGILNSLFAACKGSKLKGVAENEIKDILKETTAIANNTISLMRGGHISPSPKKTGADYPCAYCPYVAVCRSKKQD